MNVLSNKEMVKQFLDAADKINNISRRPIGNYLIVSSDIVDKLNEQGLLKMREKKIKKLLMKLNTKNITQNTYVISQGKKNIKHK